jgi:acetolactate synthase-1/2/3 large subunit
MQADPSNPEAGQRSGGRIFVDALRVHGADRMFSVPGESFLEVLDALYDSRDIQLVVAKHEGAAANMAEADGKLTGRPGICFVTRGPGATHASVGVHTAHHDSTPMILCIGQVPRSMRGREAFQEVDFSRMFGPLAKWGAEVDSTDRIPEMMLRAFQVATSGRPGPVVLSFPEDVLAATSTVADTAPFVPIEATPTDDDLAAIGRALAAASRPLVVVGGSGWSAEGCEALAAFARANALPVLASFRRQDLIDNSHPSYVGHLALGTPPHVQRLVKSADLVIALGWRLGDVPTMGYTLLTPPNPSTRLIHVHADPGELNRVYRADLPINASPSAVAIGLSALPPVPTPAWLAWSAAARTEHEAFVAVPASGPRPGVDLAVVMRYLSSHVSPDTIVTNGAGNFTVWVHRFFVYKQLATELAPTSGAMGYGLPAAVAASLRDRDRLVICVAGDGDFLMYPQELATAEQYGARVVVLLVNNGSYATVRMHQERRFPGRVSGTELSGPDYVALARSFGAYAERVDTTEAFAAAFDRARNAGRSAVLELPTDPDQITPDRRL